MFFKSQSQLTVVSVQFFDPFIFVIFTWFDSVFPWTIVARPVLNVTVPFVHTPVRQQTLYWLIPNIPNTGTASVPVIIIRFVSAKSRALTSPRFTRFFTVIPCVPVRVAFTFGFSRFAVGVCVSTKGTGIRCFTRLRFVIFLNRTRSLT